MSTKYVSVVVDTEIDVPVQDIVDGIDDSDLIDEVVKRGLLLNDLEEIYLLKRSGQDYSEALDQVLYKYIGRI